MKTAQLLQRPFLDGAVRQNTHTKMFCLTDLARFHSESTPGVDGLKLLANWKTSAPLQRFKDEICRQEDLAENELMITSMGKRGATWAHPLLMVDFALYLSPELKYLALKWVYDQLCELRDDAGDFATEMGAACKDVLGYFKPWQFAQENQMVNRIAQVPDGKRNELDERQLSRLNKVQRANINLIRSGVVSPYERERKIREAMSALRLFS